MVNRLLTTDGLKPMKSEVRKKVLIRDFYTCKRCGRTPGINGLQIAHRLRDGSGTIKWLKGILPDKPDRWLQDNIIDHPMNLVTTCCLECNDSFNIFFDEKASKKLLREILVNILDANF